MRLDKSMQSHLGITPGPPNSALIRSDDLYYHNSLRHTKGRRDHKSAIDPARHFLHMNKRYSSSDCLIYKPFTLPRTIYYLILALKVQFRTDNSDIGPLL